MMIRLTLAATVAPGQQSPPLFYLNPRRVITVSYGGGLQCMVLCNDGTTLQLGCDTSEAAMNLAHSLGEDLAIFISAEDDTVPPDETWGPGNWPAYTVRTYSVKRGGGAQQ